MTDVANEVLAVVPDLANQLLKFYFRIDILWKFEKLRKLGIIIQDTPQVNCSHT